MAKLAMLKDVISVVHAILLGLLQGITELFPISSLGHSVLLPKLLNWNISQNDPDFLTFLVATHLATATVLFLFFLKDWVKILKGLRKSIVNRKIDPSDNYAKLGWLLVVGTIPAGIIGLAFEKPLRQFFDSPLSAAIFLTINGVILLLAEHLRKNNTKSKGPATTSLAKLRWRQAILVGSAQAAALLPGISRSGSSMGGGLLVGLNNEEAARFSFLLATPIIGAAALLKLPKLFEPASEPIRGAVLAGAICAAIAAYVAVRFLVKYFETKTLRPFAWYCLVVGAILTVYFLR